MIFILITQVGEKGDGSGELIVAEGFEAGDGERGHAEGKLNGEAEIRIPRLREVQQAGVEHQIAQPAWAEGIGIAERDIPVVVMRGQACRGQRGLLHQRVVRKVAVLRCAQEPGRFRRLCPIKAQRTEVVAKGNGNGGRDGDGRNAGDQPL